MQEMQPSPVVVAVGHDPVDAALAFAAGEASRAGCGLHLVHAVHLLAQGPETVLVAETQLERAGRQALNAALEHAHDLTEGVPITSELRVGAVVPSLVEMAERARMIVLQHRDLSRARRVVTRSVSSGVAARAHVPVVSVPASWSPTPTRDQTPVVTVGVDVPDRSEQVLRAAAGEARARGAVLRVLHTWSFPGPDDDVVLRAEAQEWTKRATLETQAAIDALGGEVADVAVRVEVRRARAADALVEASHDSTLLVIGRHDPLVALGSHVGPVARAVLREAICPVMLADPRPTRPRSRPSREADRVGHVDHVDQRV